ncbi:LIC_13387 family protein [Kitasatospora sp. NPDC054939]
MNSAVSTRPTHRTGALRPFRVGAYSFVVLGTGHLVLSGAMELAAQTPERREVQDAMRKSGLTVLGVERTTLDVFNGISIAMALFIVTCGLLALTVARHAPALVEHRTAFGWICLAASLVGLAISVLLLPVPPIAVLTVAACAFALALHRAAPSGRSAG